MPDTTDSYRIGVIGTGTIGSQHCRVLSTLRQARLVAVADLSEDTARAAIGSGGAVIYTDYRRMLDKQKDIDGVMIATPPVNWAAGIMKMLVSVPAVSPSCSRFVLSSALLFSMNSRSEPWPLSFVLTMVLKLKPKSTPTFASAPTTLAGATDCAVIEARLRAPALAGPSWIAASGQVASSRARASAVAARPDGFRVPAGARTRSPARGRPAARFAGGP